MFLLVSCSGCIGSKLFTLKITHTGHPSITLDGKSIDAHEAERASGIRRRRRKEKKKKEDEAASFQLSSLFSV